MPRSEVGRGSVKPESCDRRIEKTIREQFHVRPIEVQRRAERLGRGHHLKARAELLSINLDK